MSSSVVLTCFDSWSCSAAEHCLYRKHDEVSQVLCHRCSSLYLQVSKAYRFFCVLKACIQKTIAWVLSKSSDPVCSPGCLNTRVESNDGTVLPKFGPVWSPRIRSAKMIQTTPGPKLELSRLSCHDVNLTKWSPVIILALPVLPRKI